MFFFSCSVNLVGIVNKFKNSLNAMKCKAYAVVPIQKLGSNYY